MVALLGRREGQMWVRMESQMWVRMETVQD
jgi:hypothetical protein